MMSFRSLGLTLPVLLVACATAVTEDLSDDEGSGGTQAAGGKVSTGSGGKVTGSGGSGTKAFGGTATSGGKTGSDAGEDSGGEPSTGSSGSSSGGKASGGSSGTSTGGKAGSGGSGSAGAPPLGSGSCSTTPQFQTGPSMKYKNDDLVWSTCTATGTPCIQAQPPLVTGKAYEFKCLDTYNCNTQDPGTTNWADPPWAPTKACE